MLGGLLEYSLRKEKKEPKCEISVTEIKALQAVTL
jgi:hypothetical protein